MAKGKYEKAASPGKKKNLAALLSIVLILLIAAGGTLAYVMNSTGRVQNQFEKAYVTSTVNTDGDAVSVTNTGNVDAYVRAAVVVNWISEVDGVRNVYGLAPKAGVDYTLGINSTDWVQIGEFYYYSKRVEPFGSADNADTTSNLVTSVTVNTTPPEGYELWVEVVAEAIQADGVIGDQSAVENAWGVSYPLSGG